MKIWQLFIWVLANGPGVCWVDEFGGMWLDILRGMFLELLDDIFDQVDLRLFLFYLRMLIKLHNKFFFRLTEKYVQLICM